MAQRCIMDAVEKRTSRNNQAGHRTSGRGHIASERKKQNKNISSTKWHPSSSCSFSSKCYMFFNLFVSYLKFDDLNSTRCLTSYNGINNIKYISVDGTF